ncbi:MAG: hypothetical protein WBA42_21380 [Mesorhizobium sp.]
MKKFWEDSPEWQRKEELHAELVQATKAKEEEGRCVLACIQHDNDSPHGDYWHQRRQAYKNAAERYQDAFDAWMAAHKAFRASPAGQARARWLKDPLAPAAQTEQEAA